MDHVGVPLMSALLHEWIQSLLHGLQEKPCQTPETGDRANIVQSCVISQLDAYMFGFLCIVRYYTSYAQHLLFYYQIRKHHFAEDTYTSLSVVESLVRDVLHVVSEYEGMEKVYG